MTEVQPVSFIEATKLFFTRYVDFKGRSRRSEYWWASLATFIVSSVLTAIIPDLVGLWNLAILVPGFAISVRRLHDIGKSGWWVLLNLIPLVGSIIIIIWFCQDSVEANQWGPNPKA